MKNPPAEAGDVGSIPGSGRFPAEGKSNPLQYPCLENSMERGAWRASGHGGHRESDMTERLSADNTQKLCWDLIPSLRLLSAGVQVLTAS